MNSTPGQAHEETILTDDEERELNRSCKRIIKTFYCSCVLSAGTIIYATAISSPLAQLIPLPLLGAYAVRIIDRDLDERRYNRLIHSGRTLEEIEALT